jgi:hypothetical protein
VSGLRQLGTAAALPGDIHGIVATASPYFLANRTATAHGAIVRCRHCGFVFTSPRFSGSDYDRIYKAVEPPAQVDASFENAKAARSRCSPDAARCH